jgi:hypothetical protein
MNIKSLNKFFFFLLNNLFSKGKKTLGFQDKKTIMFLFNVMAGNCGETSRINFDSKNHINIGFKRKMFLQSLQVDNM